MPEAQNHSPPLEADEDLDNPERPVDIPARPAWFQPPPRESDLDAESAHWSVVWLADRDVKVCLILGMVLLGWLAVNERDAVLQNGGPITIHRPAANRANYRIDLNVGTWVEFAQLNGIGPALARRIVADRDKNGPFRTIDDLNRVAGIGPKTLDQMRPYVRVIPRLVPSPKSLHHTQVSR